MAHLWISWNAEGQAGDYNKEWLRASKLLPEYPRYGIGSLNL